MSRDDEPVDLHAVAADDAAVEGLRAAAGDDLALVLLRELLLDVERDLPTAALHHDPATPSVVGVDATERRLARSGTVVAALAAGLLSVGGVAAASTLAPAGSPLHGFGDAMRSAAGAVVGVVTPPEAPARPAASGTSPSPSPKAVPSRAAAVPARPTPGPTVAALSRSEAAARQVDQLLVAAAELLAAGRPSAAATRLDLAERKLADVLPADRRDLAERLAALRAKASPPAAKPGRPTTSPAAEPAPAQGPRDKKAEPKGSARAARPAQDSRGKTSGRPLGQSSDRAASMNPRA